MFWYRCTECRTVISRKDIRTGDGCRKCHSMRMSLTELTFLEKIGAIIRWPGLLFEKESWKNEELKNVGRGV